MISQQPARLSHPITGISRHPGTKYVEGTAVLIPRQRAAQVLLKSGSKIRRVLLAEQGRTVGRKCELFYAVIPAEICQCESL